MKKILLLAAILVFLTVSYALAADMPKAEKGGKWTFPYTRENAIMTGYAHASLDEKGAYDIMPLMLRLGFNLDSIGFGFSDLIMPIAHKLDMRPKGFTEFLLEVFVNPVFSPDTNIESGAAVLLKYSYPLTGKLYPYFLGGGGAAYISQHTREQGAQWGFTPLLGTGITYFFKKDMAFNLEYRYRHFSNADQREPNEGINADVFLVGVSWFY